MSDQFVGEIRMFAGNFAPNEWAFCNGQLMAISQNTALFSLLGTTYGGNGTTNFALPNLQANVPIHFGQGPGLSEYDLGEVGGTSSVTLTTINLPSHTHPINATSASATTDTPDGGVMFATTPSDFRAYTNPTPSEVATMTEVDFSSLAISITGNSQPHDNMMPYLVVTYIIALEGVFPPRS